MEEYADIEPMLIQFKNDQWVHPEIERYFNPTDVGMGELTHDCDVNRIYFKNKDNETMYVIFKSNYIEEKVNKFDFENSNKQDLFKKPYIDTPMVYGMLEVVLQEDVWCPGGEQFAFTEFGEKVSEFMSKDANINFFSLDCGMFKDDDGWGWES